MSRYEIVTWAGEELDTWEKFLRAPTNLTDIFGSREWGTTLAEASGARFKVHAVIEKDRVVGGVAGHQQRFLGLKVLMPAPLAPYNGWQQIGMKGFDASKQERFIGGAQKALAVFLRHEYHLVSLQNNPAIIDLRGFLWSGFYLEERFTFKVDLGLRDALWQGLNADVRTKVRKGERLGWEIKINEDLEALLTVLEETERRQGFSHAYDQGTLRTLCRKLLDRGAARIFTAHVQGAPVAGVAVLQDRHGVLHEWLAGTCIGEDTAGAFQYLFWRILDFYLEAGEGWRQMDMDGAGIQGISYMKSHFGGRLLPVTHVMSPGLAMLQIARRAVKQRLRGG